jgi:hypothetical protein
VQQTLQLWRDVMEKMMRLWIYADFDILNSHYRLSNTGQGGSLSVEFVMSFCCSFCSFVCLCFGFASASLGLIF